MAVEFARLDAAEEAGERSRGRAEDHGGIVRFPQLDDYGIVPRMLA
ncbi:hypothetical protein ACFCX4_35000 [Kitasatospora sp. NPDC056327]